MRGMLDLRRCASVESVKRECVGTISRPESGPLLFDRAARWRLLIPYLVEVPVIDCLGEVILFGEGHRLCFNVPGQPGATARSQGGKEYRRMFVVASHAR